MSPREATPSAPETGLHCHGVSARYGSLLACESIDLDVLPGELLALIGPNGAGKTSLVGALNGTVSGAGSIELDGVRLDGLPAWRRVGVGLSTVPDNRGLFPSLSIGENLRLSALLTPKQRRAESLDDAVGLFPFLRTH